MKIVPLVLLLGVSCLATNPEVTQQWKEFQKKFDKTYRSRVEHQKRFNIFQDNLKEIEEHNKRYANGEVSWTMGINQFADWTDEEFMNSGGVLIENSTIFSKPSNINFDDLADTPDSVDWRTEGLVSKVKNQKSCNAEWAFSAVGAVEGIYKKKRGLTVELSAQNVLDCVRDVNPKIQDACATARFDEQWGLAYARSIGINLEKNYPYTGTVGDCKPTGPSYALSDMLLLTLPEEGLKKYVATYGPIPGFIGKSTRLRGYKGGVLDLPNCLSEFGQLHFGVLVVGYGNQDGKDYWLLKSCWGESFGEQGYYKLRRNIPEPTCGIGQKVYQINIL